MTTFKPTPSPTMSEGALKCYLKYGRRERIQLGADIFFNNESSSEFYALKIYSSLQWNINFFEYRLTQRLINGVVVIRPSLDGNS